MLKLVKCLKFSPLLRDMKANNIDKEHYSKFLFLLSEKAPKKSSLQNVDYQELRHYVKYCSVEDSDKIYFCGWNDHTKDRKTARNFDKTEFFFGLQVAEYCRIHNISSLWTDKPHEEIQYIPPDSYVGH